MELEFSGLIFSKKKMCFGRQVKCPLFASDCNGTWIFWSDFFEKKCPDIKFHENMSMPSFTLRRTDRRTVRHEEANSRFSQFCERAPKKVALGRNSERHSFDERLLAFSVQYVLSLYRFWNIPHLHILLYGCETWFSSLRLDHRLWVSENRRQWGKFRRNSNKRWEEGKKLRNYVWRNIETHLVSKCKEILEFLDASS